MNIDIYLEHEKLLVAKLHNTKDKSEDIYKQSLKVELESVYESLHDINVVGEYEVGKHQENLEIECKLNGLSASLLKRSTSSANGSFQHLLEIESDIEVIEKLILKLDKSVDQEEDQYVFHCTLNDKSFSVNSNISSALDRVDSTLVFTGPWGLSSFQFFYINENGEIKSSFSFKDSDGKLTETLLKYHSKGKQYKILFAFKNPITEEVELVIEGDAQQHYRFICQLTGSNSETIYASASTIITLENSRITWESTLDMPFSEFLPRIAFMGEIDLKQDIALVMKHNSVEDFDIKLELILDETKIFKIEFGAELDKIKPKLSFSAKTPYKGYENLSGISTIDLNEKQIHLQVKKNGVVYAQADVQLFMDPELRLNSNFLSPFKRFSNFGLNAETQNEMSKFEISGNREDETFGFSASYGRIKNKYGFDIVFESSEEYWEKISLGGNVDIESDIKVLDIHASSTDGSHNKEFIYKI